MRTLEEVTQMQAELDLLVVTERNQTDAQVLAAASLAIHWVLGTREGDKLPLLTGGVRHARAMLN